MSDRMGEERVGIWWVWSLTDGEDREDADRVEAYSAEEAGETWAADYDQMYLLEGGAVRVAVLGEGDEEPVVLEVTVEAVPEYTATVLERPEKQELR